MPIGYVRLTYQFYDKNGVIQLLFLKELMHIAQEYFEVDTTVSVGQYHSQLLHRTAFWGVVPSARLQHGKFCLQLLERRRRSCVNCNRTFC